MTKNIMSIAAAAAILTSGAMAFETTNGKFNIGTVADPVYIPQGTLLNINMALGDYNSSLPTDVPLYVDDTNPGQTINVDADNRGDALMFQAFNQKDGWGTEIVVRNNQNYAVVAKFVAYSAIDSQELRDFNIYLSANDVFRCTIKDGKITTTDDSVNIGAGWGVFENVTLPEESGYVAVYAMGAQVFNRIHTPTAAAEGKQDPKETLKQGYEYVLDSTRRTWRSHAMEEGVYVEDQDFGTINAPKIMANGLYVQLCDGYDVWPRGCQQGEVVSYPHLFNPNEFTLSGTVRMYNADEPRDLVMPALSLNNYTPSYESADDGFMMMWAPKELAAFADRNLIHDAAKSPYDIYSVSGIFQDSAQNSINIAYYTFNSATTDASDSSDVQNKLILTQPEKRTAVQIGLGLNFWQPGTCDRAGADSGAEVDGLLANGSTWGLVYGAQVWDEAEDTDTITQDPDVSPGGTKAKARLCAEVGEIADLEEGTEMAEKNGYAIVAFQKQAPAFITQMTASKVGGERRINWHSIAQDVNHLDHAIPTPTPAN